MPYPVADMFDGYRRLSGGWLLFTHTRTGRLFEFFIVFPKSGLVPAPGR